MRLRRTSPRITALSGDKIGMSLQPGGALLLMLAKLPSLLACPIGQPDRGRKLQPLDPGGLQLTYALSRSA